MEEKTREELEDADFRYGIWCVTIAALILCFLGPLIALLFCLIGIVVVLIRDGILDDLWWG